MRRDSDTDEIEAMTCAMHVLICAPLMGSARQSYDQHRGRNSADDVECRSRARFLVDTLHVAGWQITQLPTTEGAAT